MIWPPKHQKVAHEIQAQAEQFWPSQPPAELDLAFALPFTLFPHVLHPAHRIHKINTIHTLILHQPEKATGNFIQTYTWPATSYLDKACHAALRNLHNTTPRAQNKVKQSFSWSFLNPITKPTPPKKLAPTCCVSVRAKYKCGQPALQLNYCNIRVNYPEIIIPDTIQTLTSGERHHPTTSHLEHTHPSKTNLMVCDPLTGAQFTSAVRFMQAKGLYTVIR